MAKWPPRTWTPGKTNLDTFMNDIRDELNELHGQVAPATTGKWNPVPFLASNFSVTSGGWTVVAADVFINKYPVSAEAVFWTLWITNTNNTVITGDCAEIFRSHRHSRLMQIPTPLVWRTSITLERI